MLRIAETEIEKSALRKILEAIADNTLTGTSAWTCFSKPKTRQEFDEGQLTIDFSAEEVAALKKLKKRVVASLEHRHHRACAYCRRPVGHYGYGWHIEHVYPKSGFPERTFSLSNLTIGCVDCNQWKAARIDRNTLVNGLSIIDPLHQHFRYGNHLNLLHVATEEICFVKYTALSDQGAETYKQLQFSEIERSTVIDSVNDYYAALHNKMNDLLAVAQGDNNLADLANLLSELKSRIYTLG